MSDPLNKFTSHLRSVLIRAASFARDARSREVALGHVLSALVAEKGCIAADVLAKLRVAPRAARSARIPRHAAGDLPVSSEVQRIVTRAVSVAAEHGHRYVGTEHLLMGALQVNGPALKTGLAAPSLNLSTLRQRLAVALKSAGKFPELTENFHAPHQFGAHALPDRRNTPGHITTVASPKKKASKTPALDFFSVDLTNPASGRTLDPVIGRDTEIERVIQILCRRTKNNPLLLGDPGVGKTAIVEGLARRVMEGNVPDVLAGKRIAALDLPMVVAGTVYRGEFEGRLKQLIDEVKGNPDVILFVDEVHNLAGAGSASGSLDAANILKPALARGEIRMIGATTINEYKKHIEADSALERRFQPIQVSEPSAAETIEILRGVRENYEKFHGVSITETAIERAVQLAERYFPEKFFPDKAIDLIDEAAAAARVRTAVDAGTRERRAIEASLKEAVNAKEKAVEEERYDDAQLAKAQEAELREKLKTVVAGNAKNAVPVSIGALDVVKVVAAICRVGVDELAQDDSARLLKLEESLRATVVGQDASVATVASRLRRARIGIADPRRPIASFLFLGPTGVGKTALARALALALYDNPNSLIRLDMSEFSEPFTVSKLIGAPAGYIGYKDSAKLTDAVKRNPHAVILFDEIEKAHRDVAQLLLQILEEGQLTDATGRAVSFRNTVIILTSNLGKEVWSGNTLGFGGSTQQSTHDAAKAAASAHLQPELVNRLDAVCVFNPLDAAHIAQIVGITVHELASRLKQKRITLSVTDAARARLADLSYNTDAGAREVRRVIQEQIENPVAELILKNELSGTVTANVHDGKITLET